MVGKQKISIKEAADELRLKYSTAKTIIQLFKKTGRIERLDRKNCLSKQSSDPQLLGVRELLMPVEAIFNTRKKSLINENGSQTNYTSGNTSPFHGCLNSTSFEQNFKEGVNNHGYTRSHEIPFLEQNGAGVPHLPSLGSEPSNLVNAYSRLQLYTSMYKDLNRTLPLPIRDVDDELLPSPKAKLPLFTDEPPHFSFNNMQQLPNFSFKNCSSSKNSFDKSRNCMGENFLSNICAYLTKNEQILTEKKNSN